MVCNMKEAKEYDLEIFSRKMPKGDMQGNATIYKTQSTRTTPGSLTEQGSSHSPQILNIGSSRIHSDRFQCHAYIGSESQ